jgi:hypothetical protein
LQTREAKTERTMPTVDMDMNIIPIWGRLRWRKFRFLLSQYTVDCRLLSTLIFVCSLKCQCGVLSRRSHFASGHADRHRHMNTVSCWSTTYQRRSTV